MDTKKLRQKILDLAIHGKLVPQDPNDEPASVLLERIRAEKEALIKEGKIKKSKKSASSDTPHYENVPFEVPEGWCWCRLEDVADYGKCQTTSIEDIEDDCWILELEDIEKDSGRVLKRCTKADREIKGVRHSFCKGNVLYSKLRTYLNKVLIANEAGFCTTEIMPIECGSCLHPAYLCHVLRSKYFLDYTAQCGYGVKMPRLSTTDACKAMIPVAPIEEQKRIAVMIENLDLLIDLLDENKQILESGILQAKSKILDLAIHGKLVPQDPTDEPASELLKRINPKALASCDNPHYAEPYELPNGWTWCKLADLCSFLSRGKSPKYSDTDTTYPVFAQKCNLKEGGISLEKAQFLDPSTLCKWSEVYHLRTGDVLVNSTGTGTVGRTRLFDDACLGEYQFVVPDSHVSVIRTHSEIVSEYIYALMSSSWIQTHLGENLAGSTNQKELYIGVLQDIDVPLPPVSEQKRIAIKIGSLNQLLDSLIHLVD